MHHVATSFFEMFPEQIEYCTEEDFDHVWNI